MTVNEAVRGLREHKQQTQQAFATELGLSISGLQNYERDKLPQLKQLLTFVAAAERAGRLDLANVLKAHISAHFGWDTPSSWSFVDVIPQDEFEGHAVGAFLRCLRRPGAKHFASQALAVIDASRQIAPTPEERAGLGAVRTADQDRKFIEEAVRRGFARIVKERLVWQASGQHEERNAEPAALIRKSKAAGRK